MVDGKGSNGHKLLPFILLLNPRPSIALFQHTIFNQVIHLYTFLSLFAVVVSWLSWEGFIPLRRVVTFNRL